MGTTVASSSLLKNSAKVLRQTLANNSTQNATQHCSCGSLLLVLPSQCLAVQGNASRGGSAAVAAFHLVHRVAAAALSRANILRNLETKMQPKQIECPRRDMRIIRGVRTPEGCLDASSGAALRATTASTAPTATPASNTATNLLSEICIVATFQPGCYAPPKKTPAPPPPSPSSSPSDPLPRTHGVRPVSPPVQMPHAST